MPLLAEKTAAVIVIGNEVLSGKVEESNATFFIRQLRELGVPLRSVQVIPDELQTIADTVAAASGRFDYVFTSGGIGPTHDDMTVPAIARGFGLELAADPELGALVRRCCGDDLNPYLMRMASVPRGAELVWAEGLMFPVLKIRNVYVFPGDPKILRKKFLAIRSRFQTVAYTLRKIFTRSDEGELAAFMEEAERLHPAVQIGSYPEYDNPDYRVQITIESKDSEQAKKALEYLVERMPTGSIVRVE